MKNLIKSITMVLCFALLLSGFSSFSSSEAKEDFTNLTKMERDTIAQAPAVDAFDALCNYFTNDNENETIFPDGYGGAYRGNDNALVIKIVKGAEYLEDVFSKILAEEEVIIRYEETSISFKNLSALGEYLASECNESVVTKITVSQMHSKVIVGVNDPDYISGNVADVLKDSTKKGCISYISYVEVVFSNPETSGNIVGGSRLYRSESGILRTYGTLGFCGTYNGNPAIITAGHLLDETLYFGYSNPVGTIKAMSYSDNATGDYGILSLANASTNTITNQVYTDCNGGTGAVTSYSTNVNNLDNTSVFKFGVSTGLTLSTVTGYNPYVSYDGVRIYGLVEVVNPNGSWSLKGDSGGPVWRITTSGNRELMGVISGLDNPSAITTAYYTPMVHIIDAGFTPKTN